MKAILSKITTVDNNNQDLVAFAQTIDFTELFQQLRDYLKVDCGFEQPEIRVARGEVYIGFTSDDIASQTGAFGAILEKCYLSSFSNRVYKNKETGELGYWVSVNIQYQHKDGGSNGMEVLRGWYSASKGWIIKTTGRR